MTVSDIIRQVFGDLGFTDYALSLSGECREREYCVRTVRVTIRIGNICYSEHAASSNRTSATKTESTIIAMHALVRDCAAEAGLSLEGSLSEVCQIVEDYARWEGRLRNFPTTTGRPWWIRSPPAIPRVRNFLMKLFGRNICKCNMETNSEPRRIIVVRTCSDGKDLDPGLRLSGWEVLRASDPGTASKTIAKHDLRVGLFFLDCRSRSGGGKLFRQFTEGLFPTAPALQWVALVPRPCARDSDTHRQIVDWFCDFHTLPVQPERLAATLGHAYGMAELHRAQLPAMGSPIDHIKRPENDMVGASPVMRDLFRDLRKVARADAPVLITGESGTGKELAALAIHRHSRRAAGPFVAVNCGALPAGLIQSELFGHEKGAFTGAHQRKRGRIEAADGGTIFLDEIGDLSLDLQVNLLRFLEEKAVDRVGGTETVLVDTRVIAATNVDLDQALEEGRFRADLYFRLHVLHLEMPPLRHRAQDIQLLAQFYLGKYAAEASHKVNGFCCSALKALNRHDWPGNVRELVNRVRRAVVMCERPYIRPVHLGLERYTTEPQLPTLREARSAAEKDAIEDALRQCANNVSQAARALGISRRQLYRLMEKYCLDSVVETSLIPVESQS